jgi:hypothetical protein
MQVIVIVWVLQFERKLQEIWKLEIFLSCEWNVLEIVAALLNFFSPELLNVYAIVKNIY